MKQRMLLKMGEIVGDLLADQVIHGGADAARVFDTWAAYSPLKLTESSQCLLQKQLQSLEKKLEMMS